MRKNMIIGLLGACLIISGCSGNSQQGNNGTGQNTNGSAQPNNTPFTVQKEFKQTATITETVLYDKNNVKITAAGLTYNNSEAELELNIENNTKKDLTFRSSTLGYSCNSVNGYMVDTGYLGCDIAAGMKANQTVDFSYSELKLYGINEIADIEMGFDIDTTDYLDDSFEEIYTGPCAVSTTAASGYDYKRDAFYEGMNDPAILGEFGITVEYSAAENFLDKDGLKIISQTLVSNKDRDKMLFVEAENTLPQTIDLRTSNVAINGLKLYSSGYSYDTVNPGKRRVISLSLSKMLDEMYWESCGLNQIGSASLDITVLKDEKELTTAHLSVNTGKTASYNSQGTQVYDKNGVKIVSKGLFGGKYDYDENYYLLLMIENSSDRRITIDDDYNSISVNGYMTDYLVTTSELSSGETEILELELYGNSLAGNKIDGIDGINEIEITVIINDENREEIDKSAVKIEV